MAKLNMCFEWMQPQTRGIYREFSFRYDFRMNEKPREHKAGLVAYCCYIYVTLFKYCTARGFFHQIFLCSYWSSWCVFFFASHLTVQIVKTKDRNGGWNVNECLNMNKLPNCVCIYRLFTSQTIQMVVIEIM